MKLAEALQERADLNRRIYQLHQRLNNNALVQEGEQPSEDPKALLKKLEEDFTRLEELIVKINLANSKTVSEGKSLTELIAERDVLKQRIDIMHDLINNASQTVYRARNSEIKILPSVNVRELQKKTDELSKQLRPTDTRIQELNWTVEL